MSRRLGAKDVVAVIPAAGRSVRLAPLPCSKELLPVGSTRFPGREGKRHKVVSHYLLECLCHAGVRKGYLVIRQGKWDIPSYWGDGSLIGMDLAYVVIEGSKGPPETIDRAYPFVKDQIVAFGFPDILFRPRDVFSKLLARVDAGKAEVVLGLFPAHDPKSMDMVDVDSVGRVRGIRLKPNNTRLTYAWLCAAWRPRFTQFLHDCLSTEGLRAKHGLIGNTRIDPQGDLPVGAVLKAAVRAGIHVEGVRFPKGRYLDIGTPGAWADARRVLS